MKNTQRGFIVPLLIVIIALLFVGGGAYVFTQNKDVAPVVSGNVSLPQATSTEQTTTVQTVSFVASPTSGSVPLTVTVSWNDLHAAGYGDFGDSSQWNCSETLCAAGNTTHVYTKPGTYTLHMYRYASRPSEEDTVVGSATITVTGQNTQTTSISFSASPSSGSAPLNVMFNYNATNGTGTVQYWVDFGDGQAPQDMAYGCDLDTKTPCIKGWNHSHIYTSAGTYTARLYTSAGNIGTAIITVTGSNVAQCPTYESKPVITSIVPSSGPVGTTIEIKGCNFLGFESDKVLWFTNSKGEQGVFNGQMDASTRTSNTVMRITLPRTLCHNINWYSGLDCSVMELAPGPYTVYSNSYGGNSNTVNFTVTAQ